MTISKLARFWKKKTLMALEIPPPPPPLRNKSHEMNAGLSSLTANIQIKHHLFFQKRFFASGGNAFHNIALDVGHD